MTETDADFETEYNERFASRRKRNIFNLAELAKIAQTGGADALKDFPGLVRQRVSKDSKDALAWSIFDLWCEAAECYIFGEFQSCILACGAIVERCLKLEYEQATGQPSGQRWTLGQCIRECNGSVSENILKMAESMLEPRNDRAHANLERAEPQLAIMGGNKRGFERLGGGHGLLEYYRGDATEMVTTTCMILRLLYGPGI